MTPLDAKARALSDLKVARLWTARRILRAALGRRETALDDLAMGRPIAHGLSGAGAVEAVLLGIREVGADQGVVSLGWSDAQAVDDGATADVVDALAFPRLDQQGDRAFSGPQPFGQGEIGLRGHELLSSVLQLGEEAESPAVETPPAAEPAAGRFKGRVVRESEWLNPALARAPRIDPDKEAAAKLVLDAIYGEPPPLDGTTQAPEEVR